MCHEPETTHCIHFIGLRRRLDERFAPPLLHALRAGPVLSIKARQLVIGGREATVPACDPTASLARPGSPDMPDCSTRFRILCRRTSPEPQAASLRSRPSRLRRRRSRCFNSAGISPLVSRPGRVPSAGTRHSEDRALHGPVMEEMGRFEINAPFLSTRSLM
jgi:hypothetical protein